MLLIQIINDYFFKYLHKIVVEDKLISFEDKYVLQSYEEISKLEKFEERLLGLRTKIAYMILKLYNILINFTFKCKIL